MMAQEAFDFVSEVVDVLTQQIVLRNGHVVDGLAAKKKLESREDNEHLLYLR
jgi:hypothetical protein